MKYSETGNRSLTIRSLKLADLAASALSLLITPRKLADLPIKEADTRPDATDSRCSYFSGKR